MVIADRLTRRAHFVATVSDISAESLAKLFIDHYVRLHGLSADITSDRDSKLTSRFWSQCANLLGTKLNLAKAHHQRTDGQVKRTNAILATYLRHYVSGYQNDWDAHLALAEFAYNRQYQITIGMSPFYADIGYNPRTPADIQLLNLEETPAVMFVQQQEKILREQQARVRAGAERMKLLYDRGRWDQKFVEGDMVLISTKNFNPATIGAVRRKFAAKWIGPYEVIAFYTMVRPPTN
ncbi:unnamed protein product [Phytophthora fragariaefolia]|uniref:Unnamed protein product n=1 Tax=Phytophthora fragariaefolia TaxID=1490495 RepID=A0A9W6X919_9STRA|nr:unnamed protein product [Phytophthora fragariaefolia]